MLEFLSRHAKIRGSITELRNRSLAYKSTDYDEAVTINAEMTRWWNDVDEHLEASNSEASAISSYHRVVLIVSRHEAAIALNKHILATSKNNAAYQSALQSCITAARAIINTLHIAAQGAAQQDAESLGGGSLMWPSFTWAIWMSTFLVIYAANEDQIKYDVAIR